ncbi:unnamed protein product [Citrullus colocynthis]|uniref:Uncharacterized protein n=1 Tax=Citrullus colocynthis TaxID=252529 RepID=A0ABP0YRD5_9ROSI
MLLCHLSRRSLLLPFRRRHLRRPPLLLFLPPPPSLLRAWIAVSRQLHSATATATAVSDRLLQWLLMVLLSVSSRKNLLVGGGIEASISFLLVFLVLFDDSFSHRECALDDWI